MVQKQDIAKHLIINIKGMDPFCQSMKPLRYIYLETKSCLSLLWSLVGDHKIALLCTLRTPFKLFSELFSDEPVRQILCVQQNKSSRIVLNTQYNNLIIKIIFSDF